MPDNFQIKKPSLSSLKKMNSEELTALSAKMTSIKDQYLFVYKETQKAIHAELETTQKQEQDKRRKDDPDYDKKHQGVGIHK